MEKNTKILIGVGLAAAAYFIYMNNKKPIDIPSVAMPVEDPLPPIKNQKCPAGTTEKVVDCLVPPCETYCLDNNAPYQIEPVFLPKKPDEYLEMSN